MSNRLTDFGLRKSLDHLDALPLDPDGPLIAVRNHALRTRDRIEEGRASEGGFQAGQTCIASGRVEIVEDKSIDAPIKMHHIHFSTPSPSETQAWYVKTFGAVPGKRGRYEVADLPGVSLIFSKADAAVIPTKGRSLDHIGFEIRNLEQFVKNIEAGGLKIDQPFRQLAKSDVTLAFVIDPWGTNIELNEHLPPAGSWRIEWTAGRPLP